MGEVRIEHLGEGRFRLAGELSFGTVGGLLSQTDALFASAPMLEIDLQGVVRSDSTGLALLVEWLRESARRGKEIRFVNLPPQMLAIARVSNLDQLLAPAGE
ncbi:MAG: STAS domain-containing protein [Gammaproteobacteria bacterium]|nr:STAS domain-containing protein [Gammaproteobacteria bacterium]